MFSKQE
jgi:hypothetical protein